VRRGHRRELAAFAWTLDFPALRVIIMAAVLFMGMFLSRVFVHRSAGLCHRLRDGGSAKLRGRRANPEIAVRALLWLWVVVVYPIALTVS